MPAVRASLLSLLCLVATLSLAQNASAPGFGADGGLQVRVTWQNGQPVQQSVHIQLVNAASVTVADGYTDGQGRGAFAAVRPGRYHVQVDGSGINPVGLDVTIYPNEGVQVEYIRVTPREDSQNASHSGGLISAAEFNVPEKAKTEFAKALEAVDKGDLPTAIQRLEKAVQIYPGYSLAWNDLGVVRMKSGDKVGAKAAWEKAVSINDKLGPAYLNLARLSMADNQTEDAEKLVQKALASDPDNAQALLLLATAEAMNDEWPEALKNAQRVHLAPDHKRYSDAHRIAAQAFLHLDQPQEALTEFQAYLDETPDSPHADEVRKTMAQVQALVHAKDN